MNTETREGGEKTLRDPFDKGQSFASLNQPSPTAVSGTDQ